MKWTVIHTFHQLLSELYLGLYPFFCINMSFTCFGVIHTNLSEDRITLPHANKHIVTLPASLLLFYTSIAFPTNFPTNSPVTLAYYLEKLSKHCPTLNLLDGEFKRGHCFIH